MTEPTPSQQRIARVEAMQAEATRLLVAAHHESMKAQVGLAVRDLEEALIWLRETNFQAGTSVAVFVDLIIALAEARMTAVDIALEARGPNAVLNG